MQCSCKTAARVMAVTAPRRESTDDDSPFKILNNDGGGCDCGST
jgi:hypothetical protein